MDSILTSQALKILWLDLVLSGDEVVLIVLICRGLPSWPQKLRGVIAGAVVHDLHAELSGDRLDGDVLGSELGDVPVREMLPPVHLR